MNSKWDIYFENFLKKWKKDFADNLIAVKEFKQRQQSSKNYSNPIPQKQEKIFQSDSFHTKLEKLKEEAKNLKVFNPKPPNIIRDL